MGGKKLLDLDDGGEEEFGIKVNEGYAKRFEVR
jgi:hypothetical protein